MREMPEEDVVEVTPTAVAQKKVESDMIKELLELQYRRCKAYNTLEKCMSEVRKTKQICAFTDTMREITEEFQTVSNKIIELMKVFRTCKYAESADDVESLQDMEQLKLKLTADIHIKLQSIKDKEEDSEEVKELEEIKKRKNGLITDINNLLDELRCRAYEIDIQI